MIKLDYRKNIYLRITLHVIFWILNQSYLSYIFYRSQANKTLSIASFLEAGLGSIVLVLCTYIIIYYLIPKIVLKKQQYLYFGILYLLILSVATIADPLIYTYIYIPIFKPEALNAYLEYAYNIPFLMRLFYSKNIEIIIFFCIKFLLEFLRGYHIKENIKTEILNTELRMLKSQLHPHFLFNTLNNIYSLLLDNKNTAVSNSIDKISNILNFSINECDEQTISLAKELKIITDYIELEKLRYSNIKISLDFPKETNEIIVLPLILFTLIENAFKHGTSKSIQEKWIDANLELNDDELIFIVKNSTVNKITNDQLGYTKGIGLQNMRKRLELLVGHENFELKTENKDSFFKAVLKCKIIKQ